MATESRGKTGREWRAAIRGKDAPSGGIQNRERSTRLHREHTGGLPPTQRPSLDSAFVFIERQFIHEAGDGAMPVIEIGEATGAARIVLIVEDADKGHTDRGGVVDRSGIGVGALEIKASGEVMRNRELHGMVDGVGKGGERLEPRRRKGLE